ncbi:hypothetical protein DICPUDRAFT_17837, partial [Dictyostelium purpureum]
SSNKIISFINIRNYSTISKKKILICGNDIPGLSLALFLKKKGVSSEIVDSGNNSKNDTGIVLTNNCYNAFKNNGGGTVADELLNNSTQLNGIGYFSKYGQSYGFLNFLEYFKNIQPSNSIVFSSSESKIKEILTSQCIQSNRGEGSVSFKKGLKIKKISENEKQQQQTQQQEEGDGVFITFSNSHIKVHYDMVIGSSNCYESQDPVREYLSDKLEKSTIQDSLFGKESSMLRYFSTVINNTAELSPPIITTQFQREKKLTSFILPNNKIALSGSFLKKQLKQNEIDNNNTNFKNYVSGEFSIFEDLGAHNIVSLQDNQTELTLSTISDFTFKSYAHNSLCLIGDAADKLPQDNLFGTVIGIEDASKLVQIITKDEEYKSIPKQLQEFNKDRVTRMDQHMKVFMNDKRSIFDYHFLLLLLGKYYLKMVYSGKSQYKRLKNLI